MKEKFKIKKINKILIVFFLIISSFAYFHVAQASVATVIDDVFGWIFSLLTMIAGSMSAMIINGIVNIASYNGFINQPQIVEAWKIIRDFCNMLFILILLVIAFASILRLENYSMKRWLPKVVIMAVLINFSRTIVGVLIDASQIVMLTFVNTFAGASGNFVGILQIDKFLKAMPSVNGLRTSALLKGYAFAVIFLIVSIIVLLAVLVVFLMRVIFLWIYVALSPLAFLMMAFPGGQKYASQYWGDFTKYLINGPVLAFFIWLALSTMQSGAVIDGLSNDIISGGSTEILNADSFMSFILAIAFLVGGLMMSSQIGGMGAAWGSGMVSKAKNTGMNWGNRQTLGRAKSAAVWSKDKVVGGAKTAGNYGLGIARGLDQRLGSGLKMEGGLFATGITKGKNLLSASKFREGNQNRFEADKARYDYSIAKNDFIAKQIASGKKMEDAKDEWDKGNNFMTYKGAKWKENKEGQFYKVNSEGKKIDDQGNELDGNKFHMANFADEFGSNERITDMSKSQRDWFKGRFSSRSGAFATARMAIEAKMDDEIKKIRASGMTDSMVYESLKDNSLSSEQKQARSLYLSDGNALKGKNIEDVRRVRENFGSNNLLVKKFNDNLLKTLPNLVHNLSTDTGRKDFIKDYNKGKIDDYVDLSTLDDANFVRTMHELKGDKEFSEWTQKYAKKSAEHKSKIIESIAEQIKGAPIKDGNNLHPLRNAMLKLTNDIGRSMQNLEDPRDLKEGIRMLWSSMNTRDKANLDISNFSVENMTQYYGENANQFVNTLNSTIKENMDSKSLESIRRHTDTSDILYKSYEEALREGQKQEKKQEESKKFEEKIMKK